MKKRRIHYRYYITLTKREKEKINSQNKSFLKAVCSTFITVFDIMENKTIHSMILCFFCHRFFFRSIIGHFFFVVRFFSDFFFHFSCQKFKKHNSQGEVDEKNEQHQLLSRYPFRYSRIEEVQ